MCDRCDQWAEVRELENQLAAKIVEFDQAWRRPWRQPRLRREALDLRDRMLAAAEKVAPIRRSST